MGPESLIVKSLDQVAGPKPFDIAKTSGCGAYPNIFSDDTDEFGEHSVKSDAKVVLWALNSASSLVTNFNAKGTINYGDKRYWSRCLHLCALAIEPKVRLVVDYAYPCNMVCATLHLPFLDALASNPNGSFYGADARWTWQDMLADFKITRSKDVITHDIRGQDRLTQHFFAHAFNLRFVELFTAKSQLYRRHCGIMGI